MWETSTPQAKKTLLGGIMIKLATSLVTVWGTINIYFFSYLHHHG